MGKTKNPNRKASKKVRHNFYKKFREHRHFSPGHTPAQRLLQVSHGLYVENKELREEVQDLKDFGVVQEDTKGQQQQQIAQLQGQVHTLQHENNGLRLLPVVTQLHASQTELQRVRQVSEGLRAELGEVRRVNNNLHEAIEGLMRDNALKDSIIMRGEY